MPDDWTETPYVRVYLTLADDHPRVWNDLALLGAWLLALVEADRYWPASAPLPADIPEPQWEGLIAEGIVDQAGPRRYRFHGLDAHREGLSRRGTAGGRARAAEAPRDGRGRMVAGRSLVRVAGERSLVNAGESSVNAGESLEEVAGPSLAEDAGEDAGEREDRPASLVNAGAPAVQRHDTTRHETYESQGRVVSSSPTPAPASAPAREATGSDVIDCDDYPAHQSEHVRIGGRWRCPVCEAARTAATPFRELVGWTPPPRTPTPVEARRQAKREEQMADARAVLDPPPQEPASEERPW